MNGYRNFETWLLALWIDNESEETQRYWKARARHCLETEKYSTYEAKFLLADELKNYIDDNNPITDLHIPLRGLYEALLNSAFCEIDFVEVAETLLEGC